MIKIEPKGKALTIPMVKRCPHIKPAKGVVRMSSKMISMLAAAVHDKDEWAIILKGTRSADGFEAEVTSFWLPEQDRSGGHVEVKEYDGFEIVDGVVKNNDDIGVIHSHHNMQGNADARFSSIDRDTLNPRYPISIVIGQKKLTYLGFSYEAVGKVNLPCGAKAEVPFFIQPLDGPIINEVGRFTSETNVVEDLMDCPNHDDVAEDQFHVKFKAACGLEEPEQLRADAFGKEDKTLLKMVEALPRKQVVLFTNSVGLTQWNGSNNAIKMDKDYHWCHEHNGWDFCEFQKENGILKKLWCTTHQCVDECKAKELEGSKEDSKNGKKKGNKRDRGWLGKYEDLASRSSGTKICIAQGCTKNAIEGYSHCSPECWDKDQLKVNAVCAGPDCFKILQKGMFCSRECYDSYNAQREMCGTCNKKPADADGYCSQKCFTVAQKKLDLKWCERCENWVEFTNHTVERVDNIDSFRSCDACGTLYCESCDYGHGNDVQCIIPKGQKQPDGCIIVH